MRESLKNFKAGDGPLCDLSVGGYTGVLKDAVGIRVYQDTFYPFERKMPMVAVERKGAGSIDHFVQAHQGVVESITGVLSREYVTKSV